jgi:hypothetical protein
MRSPKRRRTTSRAAREITRQADRILEEAAIKTKEFEKQGLRSITLPRAELIRKLSGSTAHSPFLTQIGWGNAVRGSTFPLNFGIMNPDSWPYSENNLGLCVYWGPGTGVADPGESLLAADKALGVRAVELGILNASASPYYISASHVLPATLAAGGTRSDVSYLLYAINAFDASLVLERGSLSVAIS